MNSSSCKQFILNCIGILSPRGRMHFVLSYVKNRHRFPNLKKPRDLSEICIKRVLDGRVNKIAYLADKYAVRTYVEECGLACILPRLYGVYSRMEDIDFESLPMRFALKANWGAGKNIICTDKSTLDVDKCRQEIQTWFSSGSYSISEKHYDLIPRKVVCEEFIDDGSGGFPTDYKFMCIHGKVHCILVCSGRESGHTSYLPYSMDWKPLYNYYKGETSKIALASRPSNLEEMIGIAERLAHMTDFVRVDLYSNGSTIWFGELTLTPAGCIFHRWSQYALDEMGHVYKSTASEISSNVEIQNR